MAENLDPEFQDWLKSASPDAEIPTKFQVDYQNKILTELKRIVKDSAKATWPEKPDVLGEAAAARGVGSGEAGVPTGPLTAAQSEFMIWNEADLLTYRNRYDWSSAPSRCKSV